MKILFAARMARYDLLRAVQGLAARVTKWSVDCDKALHRLICYIHSTLDHKLKAFVGDRIQECKLWCFADADHAGEYDNKSTTGCFLVLIGPNTYFPLTAFSKKQTSVSVSSTEAEVVAANISLRAVGLPSSGLWAYLQNAGGIKALREVCQERVSRPNLRVTVSIGSFYGIEDCLSVSILRTGPTFSIRPSPRPFQSPSNELATPEQLSLFHPE